MQLVGSHLSYRSSRSPFRPMIQMILGIAFLLTAALGGPAFAASAEDPEMTELHGADVLGPSTPTVFNGDLRNLSRAPQWKPGDGIKEIPRREHHPPAIVPPTPKPQIDPLLAVQARAPEGARALTPPLLNFAGQGFTGVNPADTVGDVGINHYIQSINSGSGAVFTVYNKIDGSVAAGPIAMDSLGGTGNCTSGLGDPVVLFDQLASRWLLSEFSSSGNRLCIYISQTSNPVTGGWFAYQFTAPTFPDYPKYGVWPDAYYAGTNESTSTVYAFDRAQMLLGAPATAQRFTAPDLAAFGFQALIPADADGATPPPAGAPNPYMRHRDDEAHNPPGTPGQDFLEIWSFHVDWTTPANSTFTGPTNIAVAEFDSELCGFSSFSCFPQPSSSNLDPLREVVMHRLQYRNFGTHQTLVSNFVTDVDGTDHGGIRWFELRNTGSGWSLFQEGTYAPDIHHRWMGSAAMDGGGNLAVGYSVSSTTQFPSIRYAGRRSTDPLGMLQPELTVVAGTASNSSNRWGDYAALTVDPVDDSTFWLTSMYSPSSSWATRIATFKICTPPGVPVIGTAVAAAANRIDVSWSDGSPSSNSFNVYRASGSCAAPGPFAQIANNVPVMTYQDTTVSGGSTYAYRVTGVLAGCESDPSGCVNATATGACTLAPTFAGLQSVTNANQSTCTLNLSWSAATSNCAAGATYNVYRSTTPGFVPAVGNRIATGVTGTTYQDLGPLNSGQTYYYIVRAVDTVSSLEETNTVARSGAPTGPFTGTPLIDTFEGALSGGGFDTAGWTHSAVSGATNWAWSTTQSQTPSHSWFSDSLSSVSDRVLVSPDISVQAGTTLSFWHTYQLEGTVAQCYDGGTLEISTNAGASWSVLPDAAFTAGGFNGTVNANFSNPLAGKRAWCSGTIGALTQVTASLASFAGQTVRLRWHEGDDESSEGIGWFVDSVNVSATQACSSLPPTPRDFFTLAPCRLVDTRLPAYAPALQPISQRTFLLTGTCGMPSTAKAASLNVCVTQPAVGGFLTLFPSDASRPLVSTLNFAAAQTQCNNAIVKLAGDGSGQIIVYNSANGTVHLILDTNGYFE